MRTYRSGSYIAASLLYLVSCSDGGSHDPEGENTTRVLLTDAPFPFDRVERVDVHVVSVSGSLSADTSAGGSFVTLATPNRKINLLALQNGVAEELGALELPEGVITAVRLVIDAGASSITLEDGRVLTGSSTPGIDWQSSAGRPVLNALIHEQIMVPDTGGTVVIDFDVRSSPHRRLTRRAPTAASSSHQFSALRTVPGPGRLPGSFSQREIRWKMPRCASMWETRLTRRIPGRWLARPRPMIPGPSCFLS
jgi:hypothetical protein